MGTSATSPRFVSLRLSVLGLLVLGAVGCTNARRSVYQRDN